jgi:Zn-dependent protease
VRVHPLFWLIGVILGAQGGDGVRMLIWVGVVFVSILIHELGHAFTMQLFGEGARVVLYLMGGMAISESSAWGFGGGRKSRGPREQILISAAGPGAGFLVAGLVVASVFATGGSISFFVIYSVLPGWDVQLPASASVYLEELVDCLLFVNIFWGIMNLLPVYPLDGGQIARELFTINDPWNGVVRSLWLSVIMGSVAAVGGLMLFGRGGIFVALLFGSLAFSSYQALQRMGGGGSGGRPW